MSSFEPEVYYLVHDLTLALVGAYIKIELRFFCTKAEAALPYSVVLLQMLMAYSVQYGRP